VELSDGEVLRLVARWLTAQANGDPEPSPPLTTEAAARLYVIARRVPLWTDRKEPR
jgi:hypothetical protein